MEVHEDPELVTYGFPLWIPMVPGWAVGEIFIGIYRANRCIEVVANDGGGVGAFSHDFI